MRILKLTTRIIFLFILSCNLYSQGSLRINFELFKPVLSYASIDPENVYRGGASPGIGAGLQYLIPLSQKGLSIFTGVDIFYNTYNKNARNDIEKYNFKLVEITNPDFVSSKKFSNKFSKMINIPISAGLNYIFKSYERISFFGEAGITLDILKCTDFVVVATSPYKSKDFTINTDPAYAIGAKVGAGFFVNDKTSIAVNYLGFFKYDLVMKCKGDGLSHSLNGKKDVDMLNFSLGFKF